MLSSSFTSFTVSQSESLMVLGSSGTFCGSYTVTSFASSAKKCG